MEYKKISYAKLGGIVIGAIIPSAADWHIRTSTMQGPRSGALFNNIGSFQNLEAAQEFLKGMVPESVRPHIEFFEKEQ